MECLEIIKPTVALDIIQMPEDKRSPEDKRLKERLFSCIYTLFQGSFLQWILKKYDNSPYKDELLKDAKDAFQDGVKTFYLKAQEKEFEIKASLKTKIYSFCLLQLLANFKKQKFVNRESDYLNCFDLFFEEDFLEREKLEILNEREHDLMEALEKLSKKQRDILTMKFFGKLSSKQIAENLGVTVGNVDNDSTKAYKELRRIFKSKYNIQSIAK
jgi:RNA polymerase sigma factor (sigma-70 family)